MELLSDIARTLKRPAFLTHTMNTVIEMAEYFVQRQAPSSAVFVAVAASLGPHPPAACADFQNLAIQLQASAA